MALTGLDTLRVFFGEQACCVQLDMYFYVQLVLGSGSLGSGGTIFVSTGSVSSLCLY